MPRGRSRATEPLESGNRGREDTRHQLALQADVRLTGPLSIFGYWSSEDADSALESRTFTAQYLVLGVRARW